MKYFLYPPDWQKLKALSTCVTGRNRKWENSVTFQIFPLICWSFPLPLALILLIDKQEHFAFSPPSSLNSPSHWLLPVHSFVLLPFDLPTEFIISSLLTPFIPSWFFFVTASSSLVFPVPYWRYLSFMCKCFSCLVYLLSLVWLWSFPLGVYSSHISHFPLQPFFFLFYFCFVSSHYVWLGFLFVFWPHHKTCRILVSWQGLNPCSLNHCSCSDILTTGPPWKSKPLAFPDEGQPT